MFSSTGLLPGKALAFQTNCSDSDPTDPGGNGRHCTPAGPITSCSDQDPSDPSGRGRRCTPQTGNPCTDRDPTDSTGRGRNCGGGTPPSPPSPPAPPTDTSGYRGNQNATGCSDSDGGANYDRSGYGRNCQPRTGGNQAYTGCSDSDTGPNFDRANYGTHCITSRTNGNGQQGDEMPQIMASIQCDRGVPLPINISELPSQNCHIVITNWKRNTSAPVVVSLPQALDFAGNHANGIQVIGAGQEQVFNWDSPKLWGLFVFACPAQRGTGANCGSSVTAVGPWSIPITITQQGARGTTVMLTGSAFPHP